MPAYIYPGQGSQTVGMGKALASVSPAAAAVWQEADEALGESISSLAWEGPADELDLTVNAQPALLAASIAAQRALETTLDGASGAYGPPSFFAGHSIVSEQGSGHIPANALFMFVEMMISRHLGVGWRTSIAFWYSDGHFVHAVRL